MSSIEGWSMKSKKNEELQRLVNFFENVKERVDEGKVIGEDDGIRFKNDLKIEPPDDTKPKIIGKWKIFDLK